MAFRLPKTRDLDTYGKQLRRRDRAIKQNQQTIQHLARSHNAEITVVAKRRPFSADLRRSSSRTHFAGATYGRIPGTSVIPNLSKYTTPSQRPRMDPIYPSRHGIENNLSSTKTFKSRTMSDSMLASINGGGSPNRKGPRSERALFAPHQRIDDQKRQMLAGMKALKLKYRSNGVDVAVALSEAASFCGSVPPGNDQRYDVQESRGVPPTRKIELCVTTLQKVCDHPGLSAEEQEQLQVVVDHIKSGLYSSTYFGPPASAALPGGKDEDGSEKEEATPTAMEPKFYFDIATQLEHTNDHLLQTNQGLNEQLAVEKEQVKIYKGMLKESQTKVSELRETMEKMDKRNATMSRRLGFMQDSASDALEDYNKLNAMYVDLDARNTHATNQAAKFKKELTGLHKMYNGVSGELSTALKACGQLETKLKYLEPLEEEVRRKNIEIIRLEEQVKDLSSEKKRMIEDLENSKDRIKSLTRRASMVKRGSMRSMASLLVKK